MTLTPQIPRGAACKTIPGKLGAKPVALAGITGLLLAACTPQKQPVSARSGGTADGTQKVDVATAQSLFQQICVAHSPRFANSERTMDQLGMRKSERSGIYFHPELDLSVKVWPKDKGTCSMVFASRNSKRKLQQALNVSEDIDANGMRTRFSTYTEPNGTRYNRVVLEE